jgi:predicted ATP-grasp superfamily ATP-dependent carboligase
VSVLARAGRAEEVIGLQSRFAAEGHLLGEGDYKPALRAALERHAGAHDVIVPVGTESIAIVAEQADALKGRVHTWVPSPEALLTASDKSAMTRVAEEAGVATPATYRRLEPATIEEWARDQRVALPLVVKYANDDRAESWLPEERYRIVRSVEALGREYRRMHAIGPYPLVQEYVEGDGHGFFAVTDAAGAPVVTFAHRRLREYPISGGPSTLCESVADTALAEAGARLLRAVMFKGVAMVEFKRDRRRDRFVFLEVNPRFWGSLPLALQCGVDFPVYQVRLALGLPCEPVRYPVGRKMRFFLPDLRAVVAEWRAGRRVAARYLGELLDRSIRDGFHDPADRRPTAWYLRRRVLS